MKRPSFKIIPDEDEIERMPRDLRFHPADSACPRVLCSDDLDRFNRDGYLRPLRLLDAAEVLSVREYFEQLLRQVSSAGGNSYSISSAHLRYAKVHDLLTHPELVGPVTDLIGPNVVAWGSHFFCKMPGDGQAVAWHQDASYWPMTPSRAVTVWLAIDDADSENACMRFISGSHHFGHLTYRESSPDEHNVLNQTVENAEQYGQVVDNVLSAGEFSIHSDLLLHGSEPNQSSRRRCGLTLRYCAAEVNAGLGWHAKGILVAGSDPDGRWGNPARPTHE